MKRNVCNSKQAAKSQAQYNHQNAKILVFGVMLCLSQEIFPMTQEGRNPKKVRALDSESGPQCCGSTWLNGNDCSLEKGDLFVLNLEERNVQLSQDIGKG